MQRGFFLPFAGMLAALALLGASCQTQPNPTQPEAQTPEAAADNTMADETAKEGTRDILPDAVYTVNVSDSELVWRAAKVTAEHYGNISLKEGSLEIVNGIPVSGAFTIDMTTITNSDVENEAMREGLLKDLLSNNFFLVSEFPTSTFSLTRASHVSGNTYTVTGDLTIKEITKTISFPAVITNENGSLRATAIVELDRTDFDIHFRSGKFYDDLGDKLIYDPFTLELDLVAEAA